METWLLWLRLQWGQGLISVTSSSQSCLSPALNPPAASLQGSGLRSRQPLPRSLPSSLAGPLAVPHTGQACSGLRAFALRFFGLERYSHKVVLTLLRFLLTCHLRRVVPPTTPSGKRPSDHRFPYPAGAGVCACIFLQGTWPSLTLFYIRVCLISVPRVCKLPDSGTRSVFSPSPVPRAAQGRMPASPLFMETSWVPPATKLF